MEQVSLLFIWAICSRKFHSRVNKIIDIIIDTADEPSMTIYNTTGAMKMTRTNLEGTSVDLSTTRFLDLTSRMLDSIADNIQRQARKFVVRVVKIRQALHILIVLCWLITVLCDTCTALKGQQDPYNNSLSSILPCDDLLLAERVLNDASFSHDGVKMEVCFYIT
ncbi:tweety-2 like protein, partial [Tanacetum coccineum]